MGWLFCCVGLCVVVDVLVVGLGFVWCVGFGCFWCVVGVWLGLCFFVFVVGFGCFGVGVWLWW